MTNKTDKVRALDVIVDAAQWYADEGGHEGITSEHFSEIAERLRVERDKLNEGIPDEDKPDKAKKDMAYEVTPAAVLPKTNVPPSGDPNPFEFIGLADGDTITDINQILTWQSTDGNTLRQWDLLLRLASQGPFSTTDHDTAGVFYNSAGLGTTSNTASQLINFPENGEPINVRLTASSPAGVWTGWHAIQEGAYIDIQVIAPVGTGQKISLAGLSMMTMPNVVNPEGTWSAAKWATTIPSDASLIFANLNENISSKIINGEMYLNARMDPVTGGTAGSTRPEMGFNIADVTHARMVYDIRLEDDFDYGITPTKRTGKLGPGFVSDKTITGGSTDDDGFSARLIFRGADTDLPDEAYFAMYCYYVGRDNQWGDDLVLNDPSGDPHVIQRGKDYRIATEIKMNSTPTASDGFIKVWMEVDGGFKWLALEKQNIRWWGSGTPLIQRVLWQMFHGGNNDEYRPAKQNNICFKSLGFAEGAFMSASNGYVDKTGMTPLTMSDTDVSNFLLADWEALVGPNREFWEEFAFNGVTSLVTKYGKRCLCVQMKPFPSDSLRPSTRSGGGIKIYGDPDSYRVSQMIYIEAPFEWGGTSKTGKIGLGIAGKVNDGTPPSGGLPVQDGFSERLIWDNDGEAVSYRYDANTANYGTRNPLGRNLPVGQWFEHAIEVTKNSAGGVADGSVKQFINGVKFLDQENIEWFGTGNPVISRVWFFTLMGGSTDAYAPSGSENRMYFADFHHGPGKFIQTPDGPVAEFVGLSNNDVLASANETIYFSFTEPNPDRRWHLQMRTSNYGPYSTTEIDTANSFYSENGKGDLTNSSAVPINFPTNGETIHVRLTLSDPSGTWSGWNSIVQNSYVDLILIAPTITVTGGVTYAQVRAAGRTRNGYEANSDNDYVHLGEYLYNNQTVINWNHDTTNKTISPLDMPQPSAGAFELPNPTGGNDASMIQSAINSNSQVKGKPGAVYSLGSTVTVSSATAIWDVATKITSSPSTAFKITADNVKFYNSPIDGNNVGAFRVGWSVEHTADNFELIKSGVKNIRTSVGPAAGVWLRGGNNFRIVGNDFRNLYNTGAATATTSSSVLAILSSDAGSTTSASPGGLIAQNVAVEIESRKRNSPTTTDAEFFRMQNYTGEKGRVILIANRCLNAGGRFAKFQHPNGLVASNFWHWKDKNGTLGTRTLKSFVNCQIDGWDVRVVNNRILADAEGRYTSILKVQPRLNSIDLIDNVHFDYNEITCASIPAENYYGEGIQWRNKNSAVARDVNKLQSCSAKNNEFKGSGATSYVFIFGAGYPANAAGLDIDISGNTVDCNISESVFKSSSDPLPS